MTGLPARGRREELRPSDRDREQVAEALRSAAAEGRIDFAELDERIGAAYDARSYGALDVLTRDLPAGAAGAAAPSTGRAAWGSRWAVAVFGGFARKGAWTVPRSITALCLWGGGVIDLSEARFTGPETRVRAYALWGGMRVVVPADAEVYVGGVGLLGLFGRRASGPGAVGAPRIRVQGLAMWGAVTVKRAG
ncbi:hypothetical protein RVR_2859 [Actinacidiphila reveromycinica]|uniref:DUF1707 domain-containing protein n=1 Tax=Actinacidiphila reveromycinica TaxID=659352 RepID=A0A7U3UR86_9ACTN|nr:DUF1707 domain-containing protein [Streptomyces sp. SN-593]BBA97218.1 hypothetical protein RVR_2859 [Streptomyces sp. SN-593]